jgi:hypothetical protein
MWRNKARFIIPDDECIAHGTKALSQIHRGAYVRSGEIRDDQDKILWLYGPRKRGSGWGLRNPFGKPDFVILSPDAKDEVIVRRASFVPPVFNIMEAGNVVGTIRMISIFRNKYSISLDGVGSWTFRMPLYTILFFGDSDAGIDIWVAVGPSEKEWSILIKPGVPQRVLVAVLAFIHNERYFYG